MNSRDSKGWLLNSVSVHSRESTVLKCQSQQEQQQQQQQQQHIKSRLKYFQLNLVLFIKGCVCVL